MIARKPRDQVGSEAYDVDNLLDRLTCCSTLELFDRHQLARETAIVRRRVHRRRDVLSVGSGLHPGRHLFPASESRMLAIDANIDMVEHVRAHGTADEAHRGEAGKLELPDGSFDVVLDRLILHHIAHQGELGPCFEEATRLLRPGGAFVAIEPGSWHPVGAALALANKLGLGVVVHGTPDDIPLSPTGLMREARAAGLVPELHAVTYAWRRLPAGVQAIARGLDVLGSRPRAARFGHTLLLIANKP